MNIQASEPGAVLAQRPKNTNRGTQKRREELQLVFVFTFCDYPQSVYGNHQHCQSGRTDICRAGQIDGTCCPPDSCDIDDKFRYPNELNEQPEDTTQ